MAAKKKAAPKKETAHDKLVAGLVDKLYAIREERYELNRQAKKIEDQEKEIRGALIQALPKFGATGVAGKTARAQLEGKAIVVVSNVKALRKYIAKNDAWDILQQRVNATAVQERWDAKKVVPGVKPETVTVVSLHKL